jgi:hypothetical protein
MKQLRFACAVVVLALVTLSPLAADDNAVAESVKTKMAGKSLVYFVAKDPGKANAFLGIQHLQGLAFIVIRSEVDPDNVEFIEEDLGKKDFKKVYKDLTMMRGNVYIMIFDSGMDSLSVGEGSRDFIKENNKVYYLDKGFGENGFPSQEEFQAYVIKSRQLYANPEGTGRGTPIGPAGFVSSYLFQKIGLLFKKMYCRSLAPCYTDV